MGKTNIGWCDKSLNFYSWNCNKVSEGCKNCYAEAMAARMGKPFAGAPQWRETAMKEFRALKSGETAFINDMSDTFHERVPFPIIEKLFILMRQRPDVTFLLLTKRIERVAEIKDRIWWSDNIWLGTSIENRKRLNRLAILRGIAVPRKFLSIEPLLEDLGEVSFAGIDQVIVGGESGANRRPFQKAWAADIRDQCRRDGVPFYFKQGGAFKPGQDRELGGQTYDDLAWNTPGVADAVDQLGLFE